MSDIEYSFNNINDIEYNYIEQVFMSFINRNDIEYSFNSINDIDYKTLIA